MSKNKVSIGDVFEIRTEKGKGYIQYCMKDSELGELIKVTPLLHDLRPTDLITLFTCNEFYLVHFPLATAVREQLVEKVGNLPIENFTKPKYMRTKHTVRGQFIGWHIIDTATWQRQLVPKLNNKQIQLSPWGVWNYELLKERLESGWNLHRWK